MNSGPGMRTISWRGLSAVAAVIVCALTSAVRAENFDAFLAALRADAAKQGITGATFDAACAGVTPDPRVIAAMRREPEYGKPMGAYLASLVSPDRIATGQRKSAPWADTLSAVERRFGVDPNIL